MRRLCGTTTRAAAKATQLASLVARSFIPDLLVFAWYEYVALAVFAGCSVVFSFIDFNHFTDPENNPSLYNTINDRNAGLEKWRRTLMCINGAAAFTGVLSVVLTAKGKITTFVWGAVNSLLYGLFSYAYGYAGDAQLNLFFFFPMQFVGIYQWGESIDGRKDGQTTVQSTRLTWSMWLVALAASTGLAFALYYEIPHFAVQISGAYYFQGQSLPHRLDAVSSALSVVAQTLSVLCFAEQWYFWLAIDCVQIVQFTGVAGYGVVINVVVMWCLFTLNALAGLFAWHVRAVGATDENSRYATVAEDDSPGGSVSSKQRPSEEADSLTARASVAARNDVENQLLGDVLTTDPHAFGNGLGGFAPPLAPSYDSSRSPDRPRSRGLCVGKFWPFHEGHRLLLNHALQHCDELFVIVCDQPRQRPTGEQRRTAIRETIPAVHTMVVRDDCYDPADSLLWATLSRSWCHFTPDVVFTSEDYGEVWARHLGCRHVLVDRQRDQVPISGSAVRADPFSSWRFLPPSTRRQLCRRIVLVGSESTGKTTLAQGLAEHFHTLWVAEYGREVCERQLADQAAGAGGIHYKWTDEDFAEIVAVQARREDAAAESCPAGLIICDTNAWATLRWYERYMGRPPPSGLVDAVRSFSVEPTVYVFASIDGTTFVQDGYRDGEGIRGDMEVLFARELAAQGAPVVQLTGPFSQRLARALQLLAPFLT